MIPRERHARGEVTWGLRVAGLSNLSTEHHPTELDTYMKHGAIPYAIRRRYPCTFIPTSPNPRNSKRLKRVVSTLENQFRVTN